LTRNGKIDDLIAEQQRLIELLAENASGDSHAVTKGRIQYLLKIRIECWRSAGALEALHSSTLFLKSSQAPALTLRISCYRG